MGSSIPEPVPAFDPRDPVFRANPYPTYDALRRHAPVFQRQPQGDWLISRHADVRALLRNSQVGRPNLLLQTQADPGETRFVQVRNEAARIYHRWFLRLNPPHHTRLRRLFQEAFSEQHIGTMATALRTQADQLVERCRSRGNMDIISDLARPIAWSAMASLLDLPHQHMSELGRLGKECHYGFEIDAPLVYRERGLLAFIGMVQIFRQLMTGWRQNPSQSILHSALFQALADGELDEEELLSQYTLLFMGGEANTQYLIGNGVAALLRHPDQLALLRSNPELLENAVHEVIRYDSPTQLVTRIALSEVAVGDTVLPAGSVLILLTASANRDPEAFPDPDQFDISRSPNSHLGLGHGIHYCIGARLGTLEAQAALEALFLGTQDIHPVFTNLQWEETFTIRQLRSLPVRVESVGRHLSG